MLKYMGQFRLAGVADTFSIPISDLTIMHKHNSQHQVLWKEIQETQVKRSYHIYK